MSSVPTCTRQSRWPLACCKQLLTIRMHFDLNRSQLRLDSLEEHPVLISESTWQSKENRERLLELAFEGWGAPAYYTVDKNVLTAFSVGKGTAMVLDVGEEVSSCMPIYDGFVIRKGARMFSNSIREVMSLIGHIHAQPFTSHQ